MTPFLCIITKVIQDNIKKTENDRIWTQIAVSRKSSSSVRALEMAVDTFAALVSVCSVKRGVLWLAAAANSVVSLEDEYFWQ